MTNPIVPQLLLHLNTVTVIIDSTDAVNEKETIDFQVTPNPSHGSIVITFPETYTQHVNITVFNMNGNTLFAKEFHLMQERIPLDLDLPNGTYLLRVSTDNKNYTKKILIY